MDREGLKTQEERRQFLIDYLRSENPVFATLDVPVEEEEKKRLLRALMNVRCPEPIGEEFLAVQDDYLKEETREKGITDYRDLKPVKGSLYLWRGDITTLKVDGIVNAANSGMTGCYHPNHNCIDNMIHTYAGVQLRLYCNKLMEEQGYEEPTGRCKVTPGYNLPASYVLHTVGPIVEGPLTKAHEKALASCYTSCLKAAEQYGMTSVAFCCISTGVFLFPHKKAAEIAVSTVEEYLRESGRKLDVIFNVFKEEDEEIYRKILSRS